MQIREVYQLAIAASRILVSEHDDPLRFLVNLQVTWAGPDRSRLVRAALTNAPVISWPVTAPR